MRNSTRLSDDVVAARAAENPRKRNRAVEDLTGQVFNQLTVVSRADDYVNPSGNRFVQWNCRCSCGNVCVKRATSLKSGKAKSCGCARSSSNRGHGLIDLSGKRFGTRTVVCRAEDRVDAHGKKWPQWLCRCDCGAEDVVDGARLRNGTARRCPCEADVRGKGSSSTRTRKKSVRAVKEPLSDELVAQMVEPPDGPVSAHSHEKVEWRCDEGHVWTATIASRTAGAGCPYCSGRLPVPGVNDLATLRPDLAAQLVHPEEASMVGVGSGKKLEWRCVVDSSHTWMASVRNRARKSTGCPYCANRGARSQHRLPGAVEIDASLVSEAVDPSSLDGLSAGSGVKVEWKCNGGSKPHTYWMAVRKKVNGQGCPVCSGKTVVAGINDLWTTDSELASELVDEDLGYGVSRGSEKQLEWQCAKGHRWMATVYSRVSGNGCPTCSCTGTSKMEDALYDEVVKLVGADAVERHDQSILPGRYELDIVVPSKRVAIEFNGLYWHSVDAGKDPMYHARKHDQVEAAGYRLIQVWEDDWMHHRGACIAMLAAKLGVALGGRLYARGLSFEQVSGAEAFAFMDVNHIQGHCRAQWHWGLRQGDRLVAVMSARREHGVDGSIEICRYATACMVVGGFSKLLVYAEEDLMSSGVTFDKWVSFSANDVSDGNMYAKCGFSVLAENGPEYMYAGRFTGMKRVSKRSFQRKRFRDDPKLLWDESWTETEAAKRNGLWRCYDSGKIKWGKAV